MINNIENVNILDDWWIQHSRTNFLTYRRYMRSDDFLHNWFINDLCKNLQQFYLDLVAGERPVLLIQAPPQHGKSWSVTDFIAWISGKLPWLRVIYSSFSYKLGIRCNTQLQRFFDSKKHKKVFPGHRINDTNIVTISSKPKRNSEHIEYIDQKGVATNGEFRNTTVQGSVNGESLDLGVVDDAVKGREQANSILWSEKNWDWFVDDFYNRFSKIGGLLVVMTRWSTHDIIGRIEKVKSKFKGKYKLLNYKAIATTKEKFRNVGDALFPEIGKDKAWKDDQKETVSRSDGNRGWLALYQGQPTSPEGNILKRELWKYFNVLPGAEYDKDTDELVNETKGMIQMVMSVDATFKGGVKSDDVAITVLGKRNSDMFIIDLIAEKMDFSSTVKQIEKFKKQYPEIRAIFIEDKANGPAIINVLSDKIPGIIAVNPKGSKISRAEAMTYYLRAGNLHMRKDAPWTDKAMEQCSSFPNARHDDIVDSITQGVNELAFMSADEEIIAVPFKTAFNCEREESTRGDSGERIRIV